MTPYRKFELRMKLCEIVQTPKGIDPNLPIYEQEAAAEEHAIEEMAVQICDADAKFVFGEIELLKLNSGHRQNRDQFVRARIAALTKGFEEALLREFSKYLDASAAVARGEGEIRSPKLGLDWNDDPFGYRQAYGGDIDPRPGGVTQSDYERYMAENIRKLMGLDGTQFGDAAFGAPQFHDFNWNDLYKAGSVTRNSAMYGKGSPRPLQQHFASSEGYNAAVAEWKKNNE